MVIEVGHFLLISALFVALSQTIMPMFGLYLHNLSILRATRTAAIIQFILLLIAFSTLIYAFIVSDFSLQLAYSHSSSNKPIIYKISGVWGNHEGSILLWTLILSFFGACIAIFGRNIPIKLQSLTLMVQAIIGIAFLIFTIFTSNPFARLDPAPLEGNGLNPILQDQALAIHPPLLYIGYVGFSVAFSFAIAALIQGKVDAAWARWVRPWALVAWMFLTLGIAYGSFWAYYELGWGGWWFWDPVENSSFMPWLAGTALLHSAIVVEKRNSLKIWTILLAILTFSLSLLGTFLVRSGIIESVHSFASDPTRGTFILLILALFIGGSLLLFAIRANDLKSGGIFAPISREGGLILNNLLLITACGTVLFGTIYPLINETLSGNKTLAVGPNFFNLTFIPIMIPLFIILPIAALLPWKRADLVGITQRLWAIIIALIIISIILFYLKYGDNHFAIFGIILGLWLIFGSLNDILGRAKLLRIPLKHSFSRIIGLPRSIWGMTTAHIGIGIVIIGITGVSAWKKENVITMAEGESVNFAGMKIKFMETKKINGPNYIDEKGYFKITEPQNSKTIYLTAAKRYYPIRDNITSEVGIYAFWSGDLYMVFGELNSNNRRSIKILFNPLINFIWIGAVIMFIGGILSISDRRYRVGSPKKSRNIDKKSIYGAS